MSLQIVIVKLVSLNKMYWMEENNMNLLDKSALVLHTCK